MKLLFLLVAVALIWEANSAVIVGDSQGSFKVFILANFQLKILQYFIFIVNGQMVQMNAEETFMTAAEPASMKVKRHNNYGCPPNTSN